MTSLTSSRPIRGPGLPQRAPEETGAFMRPLPCCLPSAGCCSPGRGPGAPSSPGPLGSGWGSSASPLRQREEPQGPGRPQIRSRCTPGEPSWGPGPGAHPRRGSAGRAEPAPRRTERSLLFNAEPHQAGGSVFSRTLSSKAEPIDCGQEPGARRVGASCGQSQGPGASVAAGDRRGRSSGNTW